MNRNIIKSIDIIINIILLIIIIISIGNIIIISAISSGSVIIICTITGVRDLAETLCSRVVRVLILGGGWVYKILASRIHRCCYHNKMRNIINVISIIIIIIDNDISICMIINGNIILYTLRHYLVYAAS